ncbi:hypothetical protein [Paenibacillus polymyxa]|nr:hypothetical protein [Paenibacillus polymyxa]WOZ40382.1 hypothetical protein RQP19_10195 [Paenibacillus polymyxa]
MTVSVITGFATAPPGTNGSDVDEDRLGKQPACSRASSGPASSRSLNVAKRVGRWSDALYYLN